MNLTLLFLHSRLKSTPAGKIPPPKPQKGKGKGEKFSNSLRNPRKWEKKWAKNNFPLKISTVKLINFLKNFIYPNDFYPKRAEI